MARGRAGARYLLTRGDFMDLHFRPIAELAADIRARRLSPVELTRHMLARIERLDPALHSFTTVTADRALAEAQRAEEEIGRGFWRGPLHGIPIAVKDLCYTAGIPTTAGMAILADFLPDYDATVVTRLGAAGAVLLGKLHMTEGATLEHHPGLPQPTNPWQARLWTGVSSSGSGVAPVAGLCFGSLGSDTGGSIRFPSAANALTGVKPTWGPVSRHGICDLAPSYDTIGPMARSAADAAILLRVIAGFDAEDATTLAAPVPDYVSELGDQSGARGLRVGIDPAFIRLGTSAEVVACVEAAAAAFAALGAEVQVIVWPDPRPLFAHLIELQLAELAVVHEPWFPAQAERYGPWIRAGIERGRAASPLALARGTIERGKFRGRLFRLFEHVDMVLSPVFVTGTPTWEEVRAMIADDFETFMRFTAPLNAAGSPTVTLPCGFTSDGRPVGFQLIGPHLSEARLLRAAHAYQQATDWHTRRPPVG